MFFRPRYFLDPAREIFRDLVRRWVKEIVVSPALAGVPTELASTPGPAFGEATVSWAPPIDAGDAVVAGDGLGMITGYQVSIDGGPRQSLPASARNLTIVAPEDGALVAVRAVGSGDRPGVSVFVLALPLIEVFEPLPLAGPSQTSFTLSLGALADEIVVEIITPPSSAGDLDLAGDGLGVVTAYRVVIDGVEETLAPALPVELLRGGFAAGARVEVRVRALGSNGSLGTETSQTIDLPVGLGENVLVDRASGEPLVDRVSGEILHMRTN
jgi:hypothetical protein